MEIEDFKAKTVAKMVYVLCYLIPTDTTYLIFDIPYVSGNQTSFNNRLCEKKTFDGQGHEKQTAKVPKMFNEISMLKDHHTKPVPSHMTMSMKTCKFNLYCVE